MNRKINGASQGTMPNDRDDEKPKIMKNIVTKYRLTGNCEVDVDLVIKKWNKNFVISQWDKEYTLIHHNAKATNFTKSDLKVRISKQQAKEIIVELDLMPEQSAFRSGKTWRKQNV